MSHAVSTARRESHYKCHYKFSAVHLLPECNLLAPFEGEKTACSLFMQPKNQKPRVVLAGKTYKD